MYVALFHAWFTELLMYILHGVCAILTARGTRTSCAMLLYTDLYGAA
jgi:hypothetical protein